MRAWSCVLMTVCAENGANKATEQQGVQCLLFQGTQSGPVLGRT